MRRLVLLGLCASSAPSWASPMRFEVSAGGGLATGTDRSDPGGFGATADVLVHLPALESRWIAASFGLELGISNWKRARFDVRYCASPDAPGTRHPSPCPTGDIVFNEDVWWSWWTLYAHPVLRVQGTNAKVRPYVLLGLGYYSLLAPDERHAVAPSTGQTSDNSGSFDDAGLVWALGAGVQFAPWNPRYALGLFGRVHWMEHASGSASSEGFATYGVELSGLF